jgi:hypothetical protein
VWKLWPNERYPDVFVNSSLGAFVEFQYLFDRMCSQDAGQNDAIIRQAAQVMEWAWRRLDPRALADSDNHWARWLDDTKLQLGMAPHDD